MFSGVKALAIPNFLIPNHERELKLFLSNFQSLERYFPLASYEDYDLDSERDGTYFAIPEDQLVKPGLNTSLEWGRIQWEFDKLKKEYTERLERLSHPDLKLNVVLAMVGFRR
jgi:hypothetical protein